MPPFRPLILFAVAVPFAGAAAAAPASSELDEDRVTVAALQAQSVSRVLDDLLAPPAAWAAARPAPPVSLFAAPDPIAERAGIPPGHLPPPRHCLDWRPGQPPEARTAPYGC